MIQLELSAGTFDYAKRFPNSERVKTLGCKRPDQRLDQTLKEFEGRLIAEEGPGGQVGSARCSMPFIPRSYYGPLKPPSSEESAPRFWHLPRRRRIPASALAGSVNRERQPFSRSVPMKRRASCAGRPRRSCVK
jgi:hypothetical protein